MLRIDRVTARMDLLPASAPADESPAHVDVAAMLSNPRASERIKALVREALSEQLRELERRGVV
jgi:hypothetical protein